MFVRQDWMLFRSLGTLGQKAGVPAGRLKRLVLKELADNALDAAGRVRFGRLAGGGYWVEDDGDGIAGGAEVVATLFSVNRPLTSSKVLRLPTRGALGNGLRVVVGSVLATGGTLAVHTRGRAYALAPRDDGTTDVTAEGPAAARGTRVEIAFGPGMPADDLGNELAWAKQAQQFKYKKVYSGKTSAYWYDGDAFFELLQSAGDTPAAALLARFDGYGEGRGETLPAGVVAGGGWPAACDQYTRADAQALLARLRAGAQPVPWQRLPQVGGGHGEGYSQTGGVIRVEGGHGGAAAELPYRVEVWAQAADDGTSTADDRDSVTGYVNGTPITGNFTVERRGVGKIAVFGCGLHHRVDNVHRRGFNLFVNVTTPYMPITTDGKEPDFLRYYGPLSKCIGAATRKLASTFRRAVRSQSDLILRHLPASIAKAAAGPGGGTYPFSLRQLYYVVRPPVLAANPEKAELSYDYFSRVITEYEADRGEIPGMYRDPRGALYHPHLRRSIPLGTRAVRAYERPEWTFNKILYIEKAGFVNLLTETGWPERNDCAVLSSQGFASRAVRDVLDLLGDTDEEIRFFCVHDADASGTLIYQALQEATRARAARRVKIVNLGLEPWEALDMGLQVETFTAKKPLPCARYVQQHEGAGPPGAEDWADWFQGRRVELNAMTSAQFLTWLDRKMEPHHTGKVVPPAAVLRSQLETATEAAVRRRVVEEILTAGGAEARVAAEMTVRRGRLPADDELAAAVRDGLAAEPGGRWTAPVDELADRLAE